MKIRLAAAAVAALATAVAPAAAQAGTIKVDQACYQPGQTIVVTGGGFTPSGQGQVAITQDGQQLIAADTDAAGNFGVSGPAGDIGSGERATTFTATDTANLTNTASTTTRLTALQVTGTLSGRPEKKKRLRIRGFTTAKKLYAHVKKGGKVRNFTLGTPKKPCGTLRVYKRFFPRNSVPSGTYRVQIDGSRKYRSSTRPALIKSVRIFRVFGAQSSTLGGDWFARPLGL